MEFSTPESGDGRLGDETALAVDHGLEGPANGGIVGVENLFGGCFDGVGGEVAEGLHEFGGRGGLEVEVGNEVLELGLVEGVAGCIDCAGGGTAGFDY